jgi:3-oxoacyl-[acyl-carrier-protein] synthase II
MKRIVITGIGAITPLGNNIETTWQNLIKGVSGICPITKFDTRSPTFPSKIAGELKHFNPQDFMPKKDILRLDPFIQYAVAASLMALEDSGIRLTSSDSLRTGVIIGSSRGGITTMEKAMEIHLSKGTPFSAYLMSSSTINMASSYISMRFGIKGPAIGVSTACASGTSAIGEAMRLIRNGELDLVFAGGTEAPICRLAVGGYGSAGALSKRNDEPERASRPFDRDRDGFVIAEGAGVLVLEELNHALKRNARIYAELTGYGASSDAFHQTKPDSHGEAIAVKKALEDARVSPDEVDYINAHATSTVLGDITETKAIKKVFGRKTQDIHVSSCKSMLGHMLGAAGAIEAAITAISIHRGIITPTINLENPDPKCGLNHVISTMKKNINIALSNSFGFGGVNAVLVLRKYRD